MSRPMPEITLAGLAIAQHDGTRARISSGRTAEVGLR